MVEQAAVTEWGRCGAIRGGGSGRGVCTSYVVRDVTLEVQQGGPREWVPAHLIAEVTGTGGESACQALEKVEDFGNLRFVLSLAGQAVELRLEVLV